MLGVIYSETQQFVSRVPEFKISTSRNVEVNTYALYDQGQFVLLGPVGTEAADLKYLLHLHGLAIPEIKISSIVTFSMERTGNIFTIDTAGCDDRDDAIEVIHLSPIRKQIKIHIADVARAVPVDLEIFHRACSISSSLYPGIQTFHMLPYPLVRSLSLDAGTSRYVVTVTLTVRNLKIIASTITSSQVHITHNLSYSDSVPSELQSDIDYLYKITSTSDLKSMVSQLMILTNLEVGKRFFQLGKSGIQKTLTGYVYSNQALPHTGMKVEGYVQFTSPIRRCTDLLNHHLWQDHSIPDLPKILEDLPITRVKKFHSHAQIHHLVYHHKFADTITATCTGFNSGNRYAFFLIGDVTITSSLYHSSQPIQIIPLETGVKFIKGLHSYTLSFNTPITVKIIVNPKQIGITDKLTVQLIDKTWLNLVKS